MKEKKLTLAQNSLYNTIGTVGYCFLQWAITLVVVRFSSNMENAGVLQLAMSVTNIFFAIANYNMRTFQISDTKNEYSSGDYIGTRIITCSLAFLLCVIYSAFWNYPLKSLLCIGAFMLYKISESMADVYHGIIQKRYRMDLICGSYLLRGFLMLGIFIAMLIITDDVLIAISAMAVCTLTIVAIYDVSCAKQFDSVKPIFSFKKIVRLLYTCLPAVIASTAYTAIVTLPRQFLENSYGEETLGFYATVATPLIIVQVVVLSIFNPLFTEISVLYANGEYKKIQKTLGKMMLFIIGIGVVAFIGVYFVGDFALVLLYGKTIAPYTYLIYAIVGCTVMYALCGLCYNVLIILRKLKLYMAIGIFSLIVSAAISTFMIDKFFMNGVSYSVIISYIVFAVLSGTVILGTLKRRQKETLKNDN